MNDEQILARIERLFRVRQTWRWSRGMCWFWILLGAVIAILNVYVSVSNASETPFFNWGIAVMGLGVTSRAVGDLLCYARETLSRLLRLETEFSNLVFIVLFGVQVYFLLS